jgi:predicted ATPase
MIEREVRRLQTKWVAGNGWPKRLEWFEIEGIRGWEGQRFSLNFPIMAVVGENGVGKSTVLQAAASIYRPEADEPPRFASDFFPDTPWDEIRNAEIRASIREGSGQVLSTIRKPTLRWRGNPKRRRRQVVYIDLSRIQPVPARVGYIRLANPKFTEQSATDFEQGQLARFSAILGRTYDKVKMAVSSADANRQVPVINYQGSDYSGFHQGAGETTLVELLDRDIPKYCLLLIDEIESSLHPRMQRRLIRDLAEVCRVKEVQVVLTTHSPYVLDELPPEARAHLFLVGGRREIIYGVSPEFSMTRMDDVAHFECDLYVEDERAGALLTEILVAHDPDLVRRCQVIPYGAASVGKSLGQMNAENRFPRRTCVFLDGDAGPAPGCIPLPGDDPPEIVVFDALRTRGWDGIAERTGRAYADVVDACNGAVARPNHHDRVRETATNLVLGGDTLWQAMCAEWATKCLAPEDAAPITQAAEDVLQGVGAARPALAPPTRTPLEAAPAGAGASNNLDSGDGHRESVSETEPAADSLPPGTQSLF